MMSHVRAMVQAMMTHHGGLHPSHCMTHRGLHPDSDEDSYQSECYLTFQLVRMLIFAS